MQLKRTFSLYLFLSLPVLILPLADFGPYFGFSILALMFPVYFVYNLNKRLEFWVYSLFIFFSCYIIAGYNNNAWLPDVRITLTNILLLILLIWYLRKISFERIIKALFLLNIFSFLLFFLIYLKIIPNLFFDGMIAAYHDYKTSANPLFLFYVLPFIYALIHKPTDKIIIINLIMGGIVGLLSGSLQNLTLIVLIHAILILDLKRMNLKNVFFLICAALTFFFSLNYIDARYVNKMSYVFAPMESNTIQTRIQDLLYIWPEATASIEKIIFGSGIGIRSTVYRFHPTYPALSDYRTFLEIDNGFFYVFHRYGIIGFSLFLLIHKNILKKIRGFNAKVIFISIILIVNALSIHYWTQYISAILIALIIKFSHEYSQKNYSL